MRLDVDAGGYDTAAEALVGANRLVAGGYSTLTSRLGGFSAMGGDDKSSEDFVKNYDSAAAEVVAGIAELTTAFGTLGTLTLASGSNHRRANAGSVYKLPPPGEEDDSFPGGEPETVSAYTPPSSLGADSQDLPEFWNLIVDHLQGWAWPSADVDRLRQAGSAWRAMGSDLDRAPSYVDTAKAQLSDQRSPEIALASTALGEVKGTATDLAAECRNLAESCDEYAEKVETTRETIIGLLKDLAIEIGATAVVSGVLSFVTFGGAAVVGAGVATARAIACARRIIAAIKAIKVIRAIGTLARTLPRVKAIRGVLRKYRTARAVRRGSKMPGADSRHLWTSWQNYPKVRHAGREYALVGDRLYARHAVDRLQPSGLGAPAGATGAGRSISPTFIDHLLDTVKGRQVTTPEGVVRTAYESGGVRIITEDDIVITVITRTT